MPSYGEDWTADEIAICVRAYVDALKAGGAKRSVSKDIYLYRAVKLLPGRNAGAVTRRMGNISQVVSDNGGAPVIGWKPLANVGPTNTARIEAELQRAGIWKDSELS